MNLLFAASFLAVLSGFADPPEQTKSLQGVIKAIRGRVVVLAGDKVFSTTGQTQYLLETGRDPKEVTRAFLEVGMEVAASTKKDAGGETVASMVFIRRGSVTPKGMRVEGWDIAGTVKEVKDGKIVVEDILSRQDQVILVTKQTKFFFHSEKKPEATTFSVVKKGDWLIAVLRGKEREKAMAITVVIGQAKPTK